MGEQQPFMTLEEAEAIVMADLVGMYQPDYPGNPSRLGHAKLLLASQAVPAKTPSSPAKRAQTMRFAQAGS